jgi:hypothetical protein
MLFLLIFTSIWLSGGAAAAAAAAAAVLKEIQRFFKAAFLV